MLARIGGMGLRESLRAAMLILEAGVTTECGRAACSGDDDDDVVVVLRVVMTAVPELVVGGIRSASDCLIISCRRVVNVCSFKSEKLCVALTASQQTATASADNCSEAAAVTPDVIKRGRLV